MMSRKWQARWNRVNICLFDLFAEKENDLAPKDEENESEIPPKCQTRCIVLFRIRVVNVIKSWDIFWLYNQVFSTTAILWSESCLWTWWHALDKDWIVASHPAQQQLVWAGRKVPHFLNINVTLYQIKDCLYMYMFE